MDWQNLVGSTASLGINNSWEMVLYSGSESTMQKIQGNLRGSFDLPFAFLSDPASLPNLNHVTVFVIGPEAANPIPLVQGVNAVDKLISIIIFAEKTRYQKIRQLLNFSPFVGKNVSCVAYNPFADYSDLLETAHTRTRQKRSFSKFRLGEETKLSRISSPSVKLQGIGEALEEAPLGVLLVHSGGKVFSANKQARTMFPQLASNQTLLKTLFPRLDVLSLNAVFATDQHTNLETTDDRGNIFEVSISAVREGDHQHLLLLVNDVTERRLKDKRLEAILESLPQIAWTTNAEGKATYYTQGWYSYTNQSPDTALGEGWTAMLHPHDVKLALTRWNEALRNQTVYQHAARFRRFDGEYRWHLNRAVPVFSQKHLVSMWVGTSTDIHDQVMLAENLERKVQERTRSLKAANEELEQFAYVSSHDLQEPLRKIQTFANMASETAGGSLDEASRRYLDKIITTARRMSKLLKDLLSFTRIHHQEQLATVTLGEVVASVREDLELLISQTDATIRIADPLEILQVYPAQIKQLFYNLINNSIKFRSPDRPPSIDISSRMAPEELVARFPFLHQDGSYKEVVVRDNGIGFDQKYADQIFSIFQRLHSRSRFEGTGIGLAICRKVASNHGGVIFAQSRRDQGTEFHLLLPA